VKESQQVSGLCSKRTRKMEIKTEIKIETTMEINEDADLERGWK
jgi:hypothetical protein